MKRPCPYSMHFKGTGRIRTIFLAEREGFEPSVPIARHNCFRDSPVQPLLHLSLQDEYKLPLLIIQNCG